MAYGLIYQGEFSSISENDYRLEILKKDYTGPFSTLPMASDPVLHNWGPDNPKESIKGSSLTINYLNKGSNPIENFFADNDNDFQVIFYNGAQILFKGFLVQDDIREPLLDYTHPVQLSANDNLGLLKDIQLDKTDLSGYSFTTAQGDFISPLLPPQNWIYLRNCQYLPVVGTPFTISGHPVAAMNGTFTPTVVNVISSGNYDVRTNTFTGDTTAESVFINGVGGLFDFYGKNSLLKVIQICLKNTNLQLDTYIYENIYEADHNTSSSSLDQTYVDLQSFISGDNFLDCNSIITKILNRFGLTLFQALGRWNIIRWDELRLGAAINCFIYNDFVLTGTTSLSADMLFGFQQDTYPETGLTKTAFRPYQYVKETFNYVKPKYLLNNYDLQRLGALIREYDNGTTHISEYVAIDWEDTTPGPVAERFIRVEYDTTLQREIDRYLVIRGLSTDFFPVISKNIECVQYDKIQFSCTFRTNTGEVAGAAYFPIRLRNVGSVRYLKNDGATPGNNGVVTWQPIYAFAYVYEAGQHRNEWATVDTGISPGMPFTGLLNIFLPHVTNPTQDNSKETHIKDIRFDYIPYINDSTKIIGHTHKDSQNLVIKNNQDDEIYIDDSPRNSIQGTLFRNKITDLIQERTSLWHRDGVTESKKLGQIITTEQEQWRNTIRLRLDGSFRGLIQSSNHVSLLNYFKYAELPGINFLFGTLQIDYRNNKLTCSAWELFKDGEADIAEVYEFKYLYSTT